MTARSLIFCALLSSTIFSTHPAYANDYTEHDKPTLSDSQTYPDSANPPQLVLPGFGPVSDVDNEAQSPKEAESVPAETVKLAPPILKQDILADTAIAYGSFHEDVSAFNRDLTSKTDVKAATTALGTHNTEKLSAGWLAYSALLASKSPEFTYEVKKALAYFGREKTLDIFTRNPTYVLELNGAEDALQRALIASRADAQRLDRVGEKIKKQAYSMQKLGWAKARLGGSGENDAKILRLAAIQGRAPSDEVELLFTNTDLSRAIDSINALGGRSLWDNLTNVGPELKLPLLTDARFRSYAPRVSINQQRRITAGRILTLAAYRIIDETEQSSEVFAKTINDRRSKDCMATAQQIFRQCVTATHKVYERPFCIGEHALKDVGHCVGDLSIQQ